MGAIRHSARPAFRQIGGSDETSTGWLSRFIARVEKSGSISFGLEKRSAEGFSRRLGRSTVAAENPDGGLDYATGSISH